MSKTSKYITIFSAILVVAMVSVTALAADPVIDVASITSAFTSSISSTIEIVLAIVPLAGGLFALSLGIKKGIEFIKKF